MEHEVSILAREGQQGKKVPVNLYMFQICFEWDFDYNSFMVRSPVRRVLDACLSEDALRVAYVYAAGGSLLAMFVFWQPIPYELWDVQQPQLRMAITGIVCVFL